MLELLDISISKKTSSPPPIARGQYRIVRTFEDGQVEVEFSNKRRMRTRFHQCVECEQSQLQSQFEYCVSLDKNGLDIGLCQSCWQKELSRRKAVEEDARRDRYRFMFENGETGAQRRTAAIMLASPKWRDRDAIRAIYEKARHMTRKTGIPHDVDHIFPIQGVIACGLHVHQNLRVMRASANRSKGAGFSFHNSPAWNCCGIDEIRREFNMMRMEFEQREALT